MTDGIPADDEADRRTFLRLTGATALAAGGLATGAMASGSQDDGAVDAQAAATGRVPQFIGDVQVKYDQLATWEDSRGNVTAEASVLLRNIGDKTATVGVDIQRGKDGRTFERQFKVLDPGQQEYVVIRTTLKPYQQGILLRGVAKNVTAGGETSTLGAEYVD
jgi:hypothetical protein